MNSDEEERWFNAFGAGGHRGDVEFMGVVQRPGAAQPGAPYVLKAECGAQVPMSSPVHRGLGHGSAARPPACRGQPPPSV